MIGLPRLLEYLSGDEFGNLDLSVQMVVLFLEILQEQLARYCAGTVT